MNNNAIKCLGDNGVCIPLKTYSYEKKTTNADKIRAMSDEELADYLSSLIRNGHEYLTGEGDWRQWLRSEAE